MEAMRNCLRKGIRENKVAAEVACVLSREEAEALLFPFIMVSCLRTAYPYGGITDRKISRGEFVTIDMGACYK